LKKSFDRGKVRALAGLDLNVAPNEFLAITGPSGCGKSTLLHLIAALDHPDAGRLEVHGTDVTKLSDPALYRRAEVGLVFQLHNLLSHLDARRNVMLPMYGTHRHRHERRDRADELLASVGLAGFAHRRPPELSGGERQRVAIARALANDPPLLLADEPTGSLDSEAVEQVMNLFRRIRSERHLTLVMVTHDREIAASADRIVTMRDGSVVDDGCS